MTRPEWMARCTTACETAVTCAVCHMRKSPAGRSAPLESASGYCGYDCEGYSKPPYAGHLWPGELARMDAEGDHGEA